MTRVACYDDTEKVIENICDDADLTEAEVIDTLLDIVSSIDDGDEFCEVVRRYWH